MDWDRGRKALKVYGDPEAFARAIVEREFKNVESIIDEAYQASLKIIEDAYRKALSEAMKKIDDEYQRLMETLSSRRSSLELEMRNRIAEEKGRYIDEALKKAIEIVVSSKSEEWYTNFMQNILKRIAEEAQGYGKVIVKVSREDQDIARAILQTLPTGNLVLSPEPAPIKGGAIAESEDGSLRIDYSLDLLLEQNGARLRLVASKALFG